MYDLIVVGCGASGAVASIIAARRGLSVAVLEANDRGFKKLLSTGNGRCNISNKNISADNYNEESKDLFDKVYGAFDNQKTLEFFRQIGVDTVELDDGKMYPLSLQASSVVNNLLDEMNRVGVSIICGFPVIKIEKKQHFTVYSNERKISAMNLLIASGSKSGVKEKAFNSIWSILKNMGVKLRKPRPSLVQLSSDYRYLKHLSGTKVKTTANLVKNGEVIKSFWGEVLFANYGLSGIPIMNLSKYYNSSDSANYTVRLDLIESMNFDSLYNSLKNRRDLIGYKALQDFFVGLLPKSLITPTIKDNGFDSNQLANSLKDSDLKQISAYLKKFEIKINGSNDFKRSQAMAGGVDLSEVSDDLSYKKDKNLYFCGEILNVDGMCGGFNLQWAWSSGAMVGRSIKIV